MQVISNSLPVFLCLSFYLNYCLLEFFDVFSTRSSGLNNRQSTKHQEAMQQIRSNLNQLAAYPSTSMQQQYMIDLMNEMNVDQVN